MTDVRVNGVSRVLPAGSTVADLVAAVASPDRRVAVAVDGAVVPRSGWAQHVLADGAAVEVLSATAGG